VIAIVESPEMKALSRVVHQLGKQTQILHTETAFSHYAEDHESGTPE
jgi:hypothetical protein